MRISLTRPLDGGDLSREILWEGWELPQGRPEEVENICVHTKQPGLGRVGKVSGQQLKELHGTGTDTRKQHDKIGTAAR